MPSWTGLSRRHIGSNSRGKASESDPKTYLRNPDKRELSTRGSILRNEGVSYSGICTPSIITIPGQALQSGFCVYIQEVLHNEKAIGYYVGMTGDNHYPSARSPFHRLAGHFDRAARSTQRQLGKAIDALLVKHNLDLPDITLRMHYYPISGFVAIPGVSNKKRR